MCVCVSVCVCVCVRARARSSACSVCLCVGRGVGAKIKQPLESKESRSITANHCSRILQTPAENRAMSVTF